MYSRIFLAETRKAYFQMIAAIPTEKFEGLFLLPVPYARYYRRDVLFSATIVEIYCSPIPGAHWDGLLPILCR